MMIFLLLILLIKMWLVCIIFFLLLMVSFVIFLVFGKFGVIMLVNGNNVCCKFCFVLLFINELLFFVNIIGLIIYGIDLCCIK